MGHGTTTERAAAIVLGRRSVAHLAERLEESGSALKVLDDEGGVISGPPRLFNGEDADVQEQLDIAAADLARWEGEGIRMLTVLDPGYPNNLLAVHDRPPLIFVTGVLEAGDERSVAVIGSRNASPDGLEAARTVTRHLLERGYTVVSGLASGIDTAAHTTALQHEGRTVAVIGTGLHHAYPPHNASLQRRIANHGAVVSQFWPEEPPSRHTFPRRNAVMSGLARATVIVEAGPRSGARVQARMALAHGRPVFVHERTLKQDWAQDLARKPGTHAFGTPGEITDTLERLGDGALAG